MPPASQDDGREQRSPPRPVVLGHFERFAKVTSVRNPQMCHAGIGRGIQWGVQRMCRFMCSNHHNVRQGSDDGQLGFVVQPFGQGHPPCQRFIRIDADSNRTRVAMGDCQTVAGTDTTPATPRVVLGHHHQPRDVQWDRRLDDGGGLLAEAGPNIGHGCGRGHDPTPVGAGPVGLHAMRGTSPGGLTSVEAVPVGIGPVGIAHGGWSAAAVLGNHSGTNPGGGSVLAAGWHGGTTTWGARAGVEVAGGGSG